MSVAVLLTAMAVDVCAQERLVMTDVSGFAQLMAFNGQISVMRGNTLWALNQGDYVRPKEVIVTGADGSGLFKVADGSTFEVFPKSKVVFRDNGGDWRDLLNLWLGKVRVQIEHPGGVPNNNKVRTPTAVISVRGTVFDVEYDSDDDATLVIDEEGTVEVARSLRQDDKKILNPNESVRVYRNVSLARAIIDKGALWQRIAKAAMDALTQQAINNRTSGSSGSSVPTPAGATPAQGTTVTSGDKNTTTPPPAPTSPTTPVAPPAPPAPPPPPAP